MANSRVHPNRKLADYCEDIEGTAALVRRWLLVAVHGDQSDDDRAKF